MNELSSHMWDLMAIKHWWNLYCRWLVLSLSWLLAQLGRYICTCIHVMTVDLTSSLKLQSDFYTSLTSIFRNYGLKPISGQVSITPHYSIWLLLGSRSPRKHAVYWDKLLTGKQTGMKISPPIPAEWIYLNIPASLMMKNAAFALTVGPVMTEVDTSLMTPTTLVMPSIILFIARVCAGTLQEKLELVYGGGRVDKH